MVPDDENILKTKQEDRKKTKAELQAARENEDALYAMGFRPLGYEW
jgi:hypothetical protein